MEASTVLQNEKDVGQTSMMVEKVVLKLTGNGNVLIRIHEIYMMKMTAIQKKTLKVAMKVTKTLPPHL